jgi:hypothetical protein
MIEGRTDMKTALWALVMFFAFSGISHAAMSWKQVGLAGEEITSLYLADKQVGWGRLYAGTAGHGVYIQQNDSLLPLRGLLGGTEAMDSLTVNCLLAPEGSSLVFAGTNHGLHVYNYAMGAPRWLPVTGIPETNVDAMVLTQDRRLFVSCGSQIYRTHLDSFTVLWNGVQWDTLTVWDILAPGYQSPRFRCLLADPYNDSTLYAGSIFDGSRSSWMGVVRSPDYGETWELWDQGLTGGTYGAPDVFSLEAYKTFWNSPVTYLAGTEDNVWLRGEKDTAWASWKSSGLESKQIRDVAATAYTKSSVARLYAATDSGVYAYDYGTNQIQWNMINSGLPAVAVNALAPNRIVECDSLYAGTADGLYLYADWPVGVRLGAGRIEKSPGVRFTALADGEICVEFDGNRHLTADLSIRDLQGTIRAIHDDIKTGRFILKHSLAGGVYIVRVEFDGKTFIKKVVIY